MFINIKSNAVGSDAEISEITIIDKNSKIVFEFFINPYVTCDSSNWIFNSLNAADNFILSLEVGNILRNSVIIGYDMSSQVKLLVKFLSKGQTYLNKIKFIDLMDVFSKMINESDSLGGYCLKDLSSACKYYDLNYELDNKSKSDAIATLAVYQALVEDEVALSCCEVFLYHSPNTTSETVSEKEDNS
ncbi:hypothetical protein ACWIWA_08460 [Ursidibacter arcticus]